MRPLLVDLGREWRGGQEQAFLLLRGLRARGHPAEVVAIRGSPLASRAAAEGVPVHGVSRHAARWHAATRLRELLAQRRFAIVHANEPHALTAAWLARAHRGLPMMAARRVAYALSRGWLSLSRYRAARCILAVSQFVAESVVRSGLPPASVEIVHDGVEIPPPPSTELRRQARDRWSVAEDETLLGCVGYLLPEKGQNLLIQALPEWRAKHPSCRLLLAGEGKSRRELGHLARRLGVEEAVIFAGFVEEVSQIYAALDVFVFPSLAEPLGSALLAAMAHALPVVAIARGGVPEIVEDGQNGLLVASPEPEEIASAVARLLYDRELARRLGRAARQSVSERFTAEHMVEKTLRVYHRLCSPASA